MHDSRSASRKAYGAFSTFLGSESGGPLFFKQGFLRRSIQVRRFCFLLLACAWVHAGVPARTMAQVGPSPDGRTPDTGTVERVADAGVPVQQVRVLNRYPHDPQAFTQGLLFHDGFLYESTGLYGSSSVRKVRLETGAVLKKRNLPPMLFGEGLTVCGPNAIQLTWRAGIAMVYDRESLRPVGKFRYPGEGWGITYDGDRLILSDGTAFLRFLDPRTFEEVRRVEVRHGGVPVAFLNELEYIGGDVYANVWRTDRIARIFPMTGEVVAWWDLSGLREEIRGDSRAEVLNGIAFDRSGGRIFVTGKFWPVLFEIEPVPAAEAR